MKKVTFVLFRYPGEGKGSFKEYHIEVQEGMTVLDAVIRIKENVDSTGSYRASCRMGVCGSCGAIINERPQLMCQTQVLHLNTDRVVVKPMPNFPVIKDLVPNLAPLFEKHRTIHPFLIRNDREEQENPTREYLQFPEEWRFYLQFSYCIKCGLCLAACPTVATDELFLGPQALGQAFRFIADNRDEGEDERIRAVDTPHGVWRCHFAGACSEACPKGVDPAMAIQFLKRRVIARQLGLARRREIRGVAPEPVGAKRREGIPQPPPPTVK
jgi:succinate dehydrogenase / fumarate reductase iron-sulfur subunit